MGIQLIMTTVYAVAAVSGCSWAHPGANPYRGDPVAALADFDIDDATRRQLRTLMRAHRYTDVATITRDAISGNGNDHYDDLREMHSGHGQVCHGSVDRSAWSDARRERGLVYCVGDTCVIVPTICNNVSLVSRKPEEHLAATTDDEGPIDISPSAGPPPSGTAAPTDAAPPADSFAGGSAPATSTPVDSTLGDIGGGTSAGRPAGGLPIGGPGAAGGDCCIVGTVPPAAPGGSGGPGTSIPAIPETPTWLLLCSGLAAIGGWRRRLARAVIQPDAPPARG